MAGESKVTTDHKKIQKWTEEREGVPASVKGTERKGDLDTTFYPRAGAVTPALI